MSPAKGRFGRDVLGTLVTRFVVLGLGIATSVLLARVLGAEGRGLIAAILVYPTLLFSLFEGGFRQAAVFEIGRRALPSRSVVGAVLAHYALASTVSLATVVALLAWASPTDWPLLWVVLAAAQVPVKLANAMGRGLLLGRQEVRIANQVERRARLGYAVALVALFGLGALTVPSALAAGVVGQLVGLGVVLRRLRALGLAEAAWVPAVWWAMARRGSVYALGLFVIQLNYRLDVLLLERLSEAAVIGAYAVATQLVELLWQLPAAFGLVLFARSAERHDEQEGQDVIDEVARSTRVSLVLVAVAAIGVVVVAPWVVPWAFGREFAAAVPMLLALLPGVVALTTFKVINAFFAGGGRPSVAIFVLLPAALLNVALNLWWIPAYGGVGAAAASSVSYTLAGAAFVYVFVRRTGRPVRQVVWPLRADVELVRERLARRLGSRSAGGRRGS